LSNEYDRRANMCITDATINEVDGIKFLQLREWILENINKEG
jgi:hypothetical protein